MKSANGQSSAPAAEGQPPETKTPSRRQKRSPDRALQFSARDSMAEMGRQVIAYHLERMRRNEAGTVSGKDPEKLHDMRVATRRVLAALRFFGRYYKQGAAKSLVRGLRPVARVLGPVRDMDVFLTNAQSYQPAAPEGQPASLAPFIEDWRQEREALREKMLAYLAGKDYKQFMAEITAFANAQGASLAAARAGQPALVREVLPAALYTLMGKLLAYDALVPQATLEQMHTVRGEVKRLRYLLEFSSSLLGSQADGLVSSVKDLAEQLGKMNDAAVACAFIEGYIPTWQSRQASLPVAEQINPQPVYDLLARFQAERHARFTGFPAVWQHFWASDFRQKLGKAIGDLS